MRLALHWRSLKPDDLDLEVLLDVASGAGFVGVQASGPQIERFVHRRPNSRLVRAIAAAGLCQTATWLGCDAEAPEAEFLAATARLDHFVHRARAMANFGVGQAAVAIRAPARAPADAPEALGRLRRLAALLRPAGLDLLLDPADPRPGAPQARRPPTEEAQAAEQERAVAWASAAGPGVGLVVDLWRWSRLRTPEADLAPFRGVPLLGRLADAPSPLPEPPAEVPRLVPGRGGADLVTPLRRFRALGYDGYWEVEAPLAGRDVEAQAARCRRAGAHVLEAAVRP